MKWIEEKQALFRRNQELVEKVQPPHPVCLSVKIKEEKVYTLGWGFYPKSHPCFLRGLTEEICLTPVTHSVR